MTGEFKIEVKKCEDTDILKVLQRIYTSNNLDTAYEQSEYRKNGTIVKSVFQFGCIMPDVLMLAYVTDGALQVSLENTKNAYDLSQLKNRIDEYHNQIRAGLKKRKFKTGASSAMITLEKTEIRGIWHDKYKKAVENIKKKKEKMILQPLIALFVSSIALHYGIFKNEEFNKEAIKIGTTLAETYLGVIIGSLAGFFFFEEKEKAFTFNM